MASFPVQTPTPDLTEVRRLCDKYMKNRLRGSISLGESDFVFGEVMKALYGDDVFERIDAVAKPYPSK